MQLTVMFYPVLYRDPVLSGALPGVVPGVVLGVVPGVISGAVTDAKRAVEGSAHSSVAGHGVVPDARRCRHSDGVGTRLR